MESKKERQTAPPSSPCFTIERKTWMNIDPLGLVVRTHRVDKFFASRLRQTAINVFAVSHIFVPDSFLTLCRRCKCINQPADRQQPSHQPPTSQPATDHQSTHLATAHAFSPEVREHVWAKVYLSMGPVWRMAMACWQCTVLSAHWSKVPGGLVCERGRRCDSSCRCQACE